MAITVSGLKRISEGNKWKIIGNLAFDSSYAAPETMTAALIGLSQIESFEFNSVEAIAAAGYVLGQVVSSDGASVALSVWRATGSGTNADSAVVGTAVGQIFSGDLLAGHTHTATVVQEEVVGVAVDIGILANIPAGIFMVDATAGGSTGPKQVVSSASVPAAGQVSANLATGTLTFAAADGVTSSRVTYLRATTSSDSAGTPSGTNADSAVSGTAAGQVFSGTAGGLTQVSAAFDLSGLNSVQFEATGL